MSADEKTQPYETTNCPTDERLVSLLNGMLPADALESLEQHVGECETCQERLQSLAVDETDWQSWQDRLAKTQIADWTEDPDDSDTCPTCGSVWEQSSPLDSTTSIPALGSLSETSPVDTMNQVARLQRNLPEIPGYEIETLIGRGGMGVVYRARQIALNRPVALKMIVTGRHATVQQLARFQIEAEALACLTHENIVQIYECGEHDAGPYLALEFVEGPSLSDVLKRKSYTPQEAARLCMTLAKAIHLAHSRGVIHRDLKPANILMTPEGDPKITDFGLAKRLSENSQWTQTDTVMGTPHYMAPEQAAGDTQTVGPLADIYALGSILYELLSGQPPFTEGNIAELLGQICSQPAKPLRKQHSYIPRDLETICLRCLEKDRKKRYQTAEDLADDLECYLENRPIQARPIGWGERAIKWVRRRPTIAFMLFNVVSLLVIIAVGGVVYNQQLRDERDRIEKNFQLATTAVDDILHELDDESFLMGPHDEERQKALLKHVLEFSETLSEQAPDDPTMRRHLAFCQRRLGEIHRLMGNPKKARAAYQTAIHDLELLRKEQPADSEIVFQLANAHGFLGENQRETSHIEEAEESYRKALELFDPLLEGKPLPSHQADAARVLYNWSILLKDTGRLDEARSTVNRSIGWLAPLYDQFPEKRTYAQHLARSYITLGSVMRLQGAVIKGRTPYEKAIAVLTQLRNQNEHYSEYDYELALARNNFGNLLSSSKDYRDAIAQHQQAETSLERLVRDHPKIPQYQQQLANTLNSLGAVYYRQSQLESTKTTWERGITIFETLVKNRPDVPDYSGGLGMMRINLAAVVKKLDGPLETRRDLLQAGLSELRTALRANPEHSTYLPVARSAAASLIEVSYEGDALDFAIKEVDSLLANAKDNPVNANLAADATAKALSLETDQDSDWYQAFLARGRTAYQLYALSGGEEELSTEERYKPLREITAPAESE